MLCMDALVAKELYDVTIPVLILPAACWPQLRTGALARISAQSSDLVLVEET